MRKLIMAVAVLSIAAISSAQTPKSIGPLDRLGPGPHSPSMALPTQRVLYVPSQYATIQAAIDVARAGDRVQVAPGTYLENIDFLGKAITVESRAGAAVTRIDGSNPTDPDRGSVVAFMNGEGEDSVLYGFTLTGGTGTKIASISSGGGVCSYFSNPTLQYNYITGNTAERGGGICGWVSGVRVDYNAIINNHASSAGTGVYFKQWDGYPSPVLMNSWIEDNTGPWCAIFDDSDALIKDNHIKNNEGYGIFSEHSSNARVIRNSINGNGTFGIKTIHATDYLISDNTIYNQASGGGILCFDSTVTIRNNYIYNNTGVTGGGLRVEHGSDVTLINNMITSNHAECGGGIFFENEADGHLLNNSICDNTATVLGGGVCIRDFCYAITIKNNILWGNTAPLGPSLAMEGITRCTLSHTDIQGGDPAIYVDGPGAIFTWGPGMLDTDPLFQNPGTPEPHLSGLSPCIDVGDNLDPAMPALDIDGGPRIVDGDGDLIEVVDMGADEFGA